VGAATLTEDKLREAVRLTREEQVTLNVGAVECFAALRILGGWTGVLEGKGVTVVERADLGPNDWSV
jgi:hypothetical protein